LMLIKGRKTGQPDNEPGVPFRNLEKLTGTQVWGRVGGLGGERVSCDRN